MATASAADPLSRYRKAGGLLREQIRVVACWHSCVRCSASHRIFGVAGSCRGLCEVTCTIIVTH